VFGGKMHGGGRVENKERAERDLLESRLCGCCSYVGRRVKGGDVLEKKKKRL
jgi:hypothetical protein